MAQSGTAHTENRAAVCLHCVRMLNVPPHTVLPLKPPPGFGALRWCGAAAVDDSSGVCVFWFYYPCGDLSQSQRFNNESYEEPYNVFYSG